MSFSVKSLRPKRLLDCFDDDGTFNYMSYVRYKRHRSTEEADAVLQQLVEDTFALADEEVVGVKKKRLKCTSDRRGQMPMKRNAAGEMVPIDPRETIWWGLYVESPNLSNKQAIYSQVSWSFLLHIL